MASKKEVLKKNVSGKVTKKKQSNSKSNRKTQKNSNRKKPNNVKKTKVIKNVSVEHENREKTPKTKEKVVNKDVKKKALNLKSKIEKIIKYINQTKKVWIISILITLIALLIVINLDKATGKIFLSFKSYSIGEEITLKDNSKWYVIEESSSEENNIKLLSSSVIDINNDGKIDDKDKISFDSSNSCEYNTKNDKNIGYFLENKFIDKIENLIGIKKIRLLTSEEYVSIRKAMDFGYDWKEGNWLANDDLNSWWLETSKFNKIYVVTERGSYRLAKASSKNYVRPVIIISKENIK